MAKPYPATLCALIGELASLFDAKLGCRPRNKVTTAVAWFGTPITEAQFNNPRSKAMAEGHADVGQFIPLVLKFTKADGSDAVLPDDPSITLDDDTLGEIVRNAAGVPHVKLLKQGIVKVTVNQDGDPGPDESIITLSGSIFVNDPSDDAEAGSLEFGAPVTDIDQA
jgi:hypothetical protein